MSLEALKEDLKKQIAESEKQDEVKEEEVVEEPKEEEKEEPKEEEKKETAEEKPDEKAEEKPDHAAFQRLRRQAAAAEKRAAEAEEKLKQESKPEVETEEPAHDPELEDMVRSHRMQKAEKEFKDREEKFRESAPDYEGISAEYAMAIAQSIKVQNPRLSNQAIIDKAKETVLLKAANYLSKGYDPIEELYNEAKELGFTGKSLEQKEETKEEPSPDMKKVASNRSKSAGMAGASGKSNGIMTKQAAADLTAGDWNKLSKEEKRRLMYN